MSNRFIQVKNNLKINQDDEDPMSLEDYAMMITNPVEFGASSYTGIQQRRIIIEKIIEDGLTPRIPEHAGGNQHLNVGLDLFSAHDYESTMVSDSYYFSKIRTGVKMELPYGYHMMIGSRSGLGFNRHIHAFPGVIDHSYRGEIIVKLYSPIHFSVKTGDKIAQGLIFSSREYELIEGTVDVNTERGSSGFGSTDKK